LQRWLPFLRWWPYSGTVLRADLLAGLTVALVLIPQSMAYAQLAGMPAYFGLYAAFLPVAVAALWGSSNQLGSGPVAVVSLLTASMLAPLAQAGSEAYVALAITLTLMVGVLQFSLGVLKLGVIINFLSHPVIVGFTNAGAIIIALSQVGKLFGLSMPSTGFFLRDFVSLLGQLPLSHAPTMAVGALALGIIWAFKKWAPRWPGVLVAVVVTTLLAWSTGFERNLSAEGAQVRDAEVQALLSQLDQAASDSLQQAQQQARAAERVETLRRSAPDDAVARIRASGDLQVLQAQARLQAEQTAELRKQLAQVRMLRAVDAQGQTLGLYAEGRAPAGLALDGVRYRIRHVAPGRLQLRGGGEVVGAVPQGLPPLQWPSITWSSFTSLLTGALVITLVGFMEAISIAKAIAAKTRQRLDPNQELIGQGLANLVGSVSQSYPVSGSFSRSAVNHNAGAKTGMSSVFAALLVLLALLFLTPLLYHLPQATLAAIIIMAVVGLVNVQAMRHAWQASRDDGIAAVVTFVATLAFAPHLDGGIFVGVALALGLYLYRTMSPRVALLGRHGDGTLRDTLVYPDLPTGRQMVAVRFDGSLYFANTAYFEDAVLGAVAAHPDARALLIVGNGINQLDASGEEVMAHLVQRLREGGIIVVFSGLKKQVLDVMRATGLLAKVGPEHLFATEDLAIADIYRRLGHDVAGDPFVGRPSPLQGSSGSS
jgi:SulP family sulfate permease